MANIDKSRINIGGGMNPVPAVKTAAHIDRGIDHRFYDVMTGDLLPLSFVTDRINKTFQKVRKMTVEMAFDCYFLEQNWDKYGMNESWNEWADITLPISRSYRFDIRKSIDLLMEKSGDKPFDELVTDAMTHFDQIGIGTLKLVAQVQEPERQQEILADLKAGKKVKKDAILAENKKEQPQKAEQKPRPVSPDDSFKRGMFVVFADEKCEIVAVDFIEETLDICCPDKDVIQVVMTACVWMKE